MEVYTGFKKIPWAKKQRPRKAFSKRKRRPTSNVLSTHERVFKLQPSKNRSEIYIGLSLVFVILITAGLNYSVSRFTDYHNTRSAKMQKLAERFDNKAFEFLINSGKSRLISNNLKGAYSEFKLAHAIYPENEELNTLMIETLSVLCKDENAYCSDLDAILSKSH